MPTKGEKVNFYFEKDGVYVPVEDLQDVTIEEADDVMAKINYVRVVRCKDCVYATHVIGSACECVVRRDGVNENGYCHSGCER